MTQISFPGLPAYSAVPASLAGRAAACLLDALWVILPALLLFLVLSGIAGDVARMGDATLATGLSLAAWLGAGLLAAVSFVYWAALLGRGTTPGLHALGLHLVRIGEGGYVDAPGFVRALVRAVVFTLGASILVGPFSPLFDRTAARRGWHDRVSDTRVTLATVEAATSEPEEGAWLPVDRLAPPRKPGRPASRPPVPVPAPAPPIRPQATAAPVDPVSSPEPFVPKSRTTYTTPPDAAERYPFMRSSVDFDDLDRTRSAGALSQQGTVQWVLRLDTGEAFDVQGGRPDRAQSGGHRRPGVPADRLCGHHDEHLEDAPELRARGRQAVADRSALHQRVEPHPSRKRTTSDQHRRSHVRGTGGLDRTR